jgi:hypothetical protein
MNKKTFIFIFVILLFIFKVNDVFAAKLYFDVYKNSTDGSISSDDYLLKVKLDTQGETINAVDGKVVLPKDIIEIKEIHDGNSNINFWLQSPIEKNKGEIEFSGITPGGISGENLLLFSTIVHQNNKNQGNILFDSIKVLKNDGQGTEIKTSITNLDLPINTPRSIADIKDILVKDIVSPEVFEPNILNNVDSFGDKNLIVFATQDKDSGISHYEIKEGFFDSFRKVESPYLLEKQDLHSKIYIKAVDNAGNERVIEFYPVGKIRWYLRYGIIGIILAVIAFFGVRQVWLKFIR